MDSEEYLLLSDVQRYSYCKTSFYLYRVYGCWEDNIHTTVGTHLHKKTDNVSVRETRGDKFIARGLEVISYRLKIRGRLDTVEFYKNKNGVSVVGREGKWIPLVCEYKKSNKGININTHLIQLTAQILCLEEMLGITLTRGVIVDRGHGNKRVEYVITDELKEGVEILIQNMWETYLTKTVTKSDYHYRKCTGCSLYNYCLPKLE